MSVSEDIARIRTLLNIKRMSAPSKAARDDFNLALAALERLEQRSAETLLEAARELLTPPAFGGQLFTSEEWTARRIAWHRLDGNDALADQMLADENSVRRAFEKEPLDV